MYTGLTNVTSRKIAERKGLSLAAQVKEASVKAGDMDAALREDRSFEPVSDTAEAARLAARCREAFRGYFVFNRTFYAFNDANAAWLAEQGMLYRRGDSVLALGARFNRQAGLQIGFLCGDVKAAVGFAKGETLRRGLPQLVIDIPDGDAALRSALEAEGFAFMDSTIIMLRKDF